VLVVAALAALTYAIIEGWRIGFGAVGIVVVLTLALGCFAALRCCQPASPVLGSSAPRPPESRSTTQRTSEPSKPGRRDPRGTGAGGSRHFALERVGPATSAELTKELGFEEVPYVVPGRLQTLSWRGLVDRLMRKGRPAVYSVSDYGRRELQRGGRL
jgi:hypothetical protein